MFRRLRIPIPRLIFLALIPLAVACSNESDASTVLVRFPDTSAPPIRAELASTDGARQLGLMYRKDLGESDGMLFLFPVQKPLSFWMKNTYIELDIIFLDSSFRIVSIAERCTPMTETPRPSAAPAQYVLEVRGGSASRWNLKQGSVAKIEGVLPVPR